MRRRNTCIAIGGRPTDGTSDVRVILKRRYEPSGAKQSKTIFTKIPNCFHFTIFHNNIFFNFPLDSPLSNMITFLTHLPSLFVQ